MSRAAAGGQVRPGAGSAGPESLWWLIPVGFVLAAAAATATFLGGRLASGVTGHGFTGPRWRLAGPADLVHHDAAWPGVPAAALWVCAVVLFVLAAVLVTVPVVLVVRGARRARPAARSMATRADVATWTPHGRPRSRCGCGPRWPRTARSPAGDDPVRCSRDG